MTQQSQTNHIDTLIVPITSTLRQRYLLDTSTARHIDLRFLHHLHPYCCSSWRYN